MFGLSTIGHRKEIRVLTFRVLALYQNESTKEGLTLEASEFRICTDVEDTHNNNNNNNNNVFIHQIKIHIRCYNN